ncbi:thiopeptide-type bacteriocin biosynthesis protein [Pseudofrankia sp. DC12]|uniref:thiopeptide-type bacteriocin biosynthesis protein n=1 Tax=Pseudofrankia sp. DC12 TaxID=683315 RepID=UPI0005F798F0|nr:thiopeptide-type bacteriocin biosynthesis protein [Pseudofrankia sp. DC12]
MNETAWRQVNITYPGHDRRQRERHAVDHLAHVLPAAEADGLITAWFFIRKGPWRIRYLLTQDAAGGHRGPNGDPVRPLLVDGVSWTPDIYEPETHAFGGTASMHSAHALFHHDSHYLLPYLIDNPTDRRERSLLLCTALMRTAGLDLNEQGDVWARIAGLRPLATRGPLDLQNWVSFTSNVRHLLLGHARVGLIDHSWISAFEEAGRKLRAHRENGTLTRGLRAVITQYVIFHWNRLGLSAVTQATLARAAREALFRSRAAPVS